MEPSTAFMIIMAIFGAMQQQAAADDAATASKNAVMLEQSRQDRIQEQRDAALKDALAKNKPAQQQDVQQQEADKINAAITPSALKENDGTYSSTAGAPTEIADSLSRTLAKTLKGSQDYAKNLAGLNSYNNLNFTNALNNKRAAETANLLNSNSRNSVSLLPGELQTAARAGDEAAQYGDIANGVSQVAYNQWLKGGSSRPAMQQASSWYAYD